jgi:type I restriction enzyme S subunit
MSEQVNITESVEITNNRVKPFSGQRRYLATGDLVGEEISGITPVDYETKPSRADLLVNECDIIVARMKATNKVFLIDKNNKDLIVSTGFLTLRPQKEFDPVYLTHFFRSEIFQRQKDKSCSGATQKAINNGAFEKLFIPSYSLSEQKKIAEVLDYADALRQKRNRSIQLLSELMHATFLDMFSASKRNKWPEVLISDLAEKRKGSMRTGPFGSALLHSEFVDQGIAVLGIDNAVENRFSWKERRYITPKKYELLKQYTVHPGDVIITIMGTLGRSAVVPDDIPVAINTKHLACITLNKEIASPYFISYSFYSDPLILRQLGRSKRGAIMDGLNLSIIKELKIFLPPIDLQNKFVGIMNKIEAVKARMLVGFEEMDNQFNALIQKHFG